MNSGGYSKSLPAKETGTNLIPSTYEIHGKPFNWTQIIPFEEVIQRGFALFVDVTLFCIPL